MYHEQNIRVNDKGEIIETIQKEWAQDHDRSTTFLDNQNGALRLIARMTTDLGEDTVNAPRVLLITPVGLQ